MYSQMALHRFACEITAVSRLNLHMLVVNSLRHSRDEANKLAVQMGVDAKLIEREDAFCFIAAPADTFERMSMQSRHIQKGVYGIYGQPS